MLIYLTRNGNQLCHFTHRKITPIHSFVPLLSPVTRASSTTSSSSTSEDPPSEPESADLKLTSRAYFFPAWWPCIPATLTKNISVLMRLSLTLDPHVSSHTHCCHQRRLTSTPWILLLSAACFWEFSKISRLILRSTSSNSPCQETSMTRPKLQLLLCCLMSLRCQLWTCVTRLSLLSIPTGKFHQPTTENYLLSKHFVT